LFPDWNQFLENTYFEQQPYPLNPNHFQLQNNGSLNINSERRKNPVPVIHLSQKDISIPPRGQKSKGERQGRISRRRDSGSEKGDIRGRDSLDPEGRIYKHYYKLD